LDNKKPAIRWWKRAAVDLALSAALACHLPYRPLYEQHVDNHKHQKVEFGHFVAVNPKSRFVVSPYAQK